MCRKFGLKMLVLTALLLLLFVFGGKLDVCAKGGPEPGDVELKARSIQGVLLIELLDTPSPFEIEIQVTLVGEFLEKVGTFPVAIGPLDRTVEGTEGSFAEATIKDLEGWTVTGAGPAGLFSEGGGETLVITRVRGLYNSVLSNGNRVIGAKVTVKALK